MNLSENDANEATRHWPTREEVRSIVRVIVESIDRSGPVKINPQWLPRPKVEPPKRPPITFTQQQIDAAKELARKELGDGASDVAVDSNRYSDKGVERNDLSENPPTILPQQDLPL